ncbi:HEAT repeat-containing protein 1, partial [Frankliniella fusca]
HACDKDGDAIKRSSASDGRQSHHLVAHGQQPPARRCLAPSNEVELIGVAFPLMKQMLKKNKVTVHRSVEKRERLEEQVFTVLTGSGSGKDRMVFHTVVQGDFS